MQPTTTRFTFRTSRQVPRLGVMLVGWGGNNGSTLTAAVLANRLRLTWPTRTGRKVGAVGAGGGKGGEDSEGRGRLRRCGRPDSQPPLGTRAAAGACGGGGVACGICWSRGAWPRPLNTLLFCHLPPAPRRQTIMAR